MQQLQYPIGQYEPQPYNEQIKRKWLQDIQFLPSAIEMAIENMDAAQLEVPYRPNGWCSKQVVHHVADSHMHAYIRCKLAYTEDNPTIKTYQEQLWATTKDVTDVPINMSITLLYALHTRWHHFLLHLTPNDWAKTIVHPAHNKTMSLWYLLGLYAWHGKHHVAHIELVKQSYNR